MPISGGYKVRVTPITKGQVALLEKKVSKKDDDGLTWLSIALTIAEVGAMFIPGVGPLASTGIAAIGAAAQTGIEYAQTGTVSPTSIGLNAASLFLPGVTHGVGAVIKNSAWGINRAIEKTAIGAQKAFEAAKNTVGDSAIVGKAVTSWSKEILETTKQAKYLKRTQELAKIFRGETEMVIGNGLTRPFISGEVENLFSQTLTKGTRGGLEALDEGTRETEKDLSLSENIEREFIDKFGVLDAQELFRRVTRAESASERDTIIRLFLVEKLSTEDAWVFTQRIREITKGSFRTTQGVADANKAAAEAMRAAKAANKELFNEASNVQRFNYFMRKIGSAKFNDRVVQIVQLMDPADAGRYIIERLYRRMVKYFKPLMRMLGSVNKIDEAFVKAGGTLVNSNVIVGYRVIGYNKKNPMYTDIMISFYPEATRSKHATSRNGKANKNYHGKPPVFVTASNIEITGLVEGGMKYYLSKWAITRGGSAATFSSLEGMGMALMMILPFMQTGMLRNILSLGSNISKMSKRFAKSGLDGWGDDFIKSFRRAIVNRPGRFLARGIIAPLAGRFGRLTALIVSRESQRLIGIATTAANAAIEGRKPKNFYKTFQSQFKSAVGSYGNRVMRSGGRGKALIAQKKYRRKINMVKRLPRAFGL